MFIWGPIRRRMGCPCTVQIMFVMIHSIESRSSSIMCILIENIEIEKACIITCRQQLPTQLRHSMWLQVAQQLKIMMSVSLERSPRRQLPLTFRPSTLRCRLTLPGLLRCSLEPRAPHRALLVAGSATQAMLHSHSCASCPVSHPFCHCCERIHRKCMYVHAECLPVRQASMSRCT